MRRYLILYLFIMILSSCFKEDTITVHPKVLFLEEGITLINNDDFDYYNVSVIIAGKYYAYCNYLSSGNRKDFAYYELNKFADYKKLKNACYKVSLKDFNRNKRLFTNEKDQYILNNKIIKKEIKLIQKKIN